jgi:TonB family protein
MNWQKLLCFVLMCFGFSLVYAAAQTQPAAGPPAAAPATPPSSATAAAAPLPDPKTPEEFFARARQLSDLEASGIPFHLKATYVASGDAEFTGNGTYQEWWQSKDLWRKEATLGDYKYVEVEYGGKNTAYGTSDYIPLRLRQMLDAVLIRIAPDAGKASDWHLKHEKLDGLEFVLLSVDGRCGEGHPEAKCVTKDYLTPNGVLRIHARDVIETLYNGMQPFGALFVPRNIVVASDGATTLDISISSLKLLGQNEILSEIDRPLPDRLHLTTKPFDVKVFPPAETRTRPVKVVPPIYPAQAKWRRIMGTVVINTGIDQSGNSREPYVIRSAGPLLDRSALTAVRQWKYTPVLVQGVPVDVETTIFIVYTLNY